MTTPRPRARDLGIVLGDLPTGPWNAITDVAGTLVGHATVVGPGIRTGVTAVVPASGDLRRDPRRAGLFVANGYGKITGATQVVELGEIETPILLTGTLSTFRVADALVEWVLERDGNDGVRSVNPVVAETNDARWRARGHRPSVGRPEVFEALATATAGPVAEGCVGAGTGTVAFGYKAGIGTSSRRVALGDGAATVGVLVQANHGGRLQAPGAPRRLPGRADDDADGSVIVLVAVDAPLDARQLTRLAKRAAYALARTGAQYGGVSGDYALAFSTFASSAPECLSDDRLEPLWVAVQDAVDESVLNSLAAAQDAATESGTVIPAIPPDALRDLAASR